mgnify:FL=1
MKFVRKCAVLCLSLCALAGRPVWSADAPVAVINGKAIPAWLMERNVQANVAQGQVDSPALRAALTEELIARELMVQEATRRGLDKRPGNEAALLTLRQNLLIDMLLQDELSKSPLGVPDLRQEYERQVRLLSSDDLQQYQVASIVVGSEAEAREVMASLRSGQSFEAQAKARSLDPSKGRGGELGWLLADQITPAISNVVVNLSPGAVSVAPIQVGQYWHVVKVLAKRAYKVPTFEESEEQLRQAVMQNRRLQLLKKLKDDAKFR